MHMSSPAAELLQVEASIMEMPAVLLAGGMVRKVSPGGIRRLGEALHLAAPETEHSHGMPEGWEVDLPFPAA